MDLIARFSIFKHLSSWSEEEGAGTEYNLVINERDQFIKVSSEDDALEKICDKYTLSLKDFEKMEDYENRYSASIIEDADGSPCGHGKWFAEYSIYISLYKKLTTQECTALNRSQNEKY